LYSPIWVLITNSGPKQFGFSRKGSTGYLSGVFKDTLKEIGKDWQLYGMHSFRYGGAGHKLNHSTYRYTLEEIRHVAGWTVSDGEDTLGKYLLKQLSKEKQIQNASVMLTCREGRDVKGTLRFHTEMIKQISNQIHGLNAPRQVIYASREEEIKACEKKLNELKSQSLSKNTPSIAPVLTVERSLAVDVTMKASDLIPDILLAHSVQEVIQQWFLGCGGQIALKDWPSSWRNTKAGSKNRVKWSQRRSIAMMYERYQAKYGKAAGAAKFMEVYGKCSVREARSRCPKESVK
jgi:hypothetical protein